MTAVICGRTNRSERAEQITRVLREQQGFCLDIGCGRSFDLDNEIQHMRISRCFECWRWLCSPCIVAHFEATNDAYQSGSTEDLAVDRSAHEEVNDAPPAVADETGRGASHRRQGVQSFRSSVTRPDTHATPTAARIPSVATRPESATSMK